MPGAKIDLICLIWSSVSKEARGKTCALALTQLLEIGGVWLLVEDVQVESLVPESEGHCVSQRVLVTSVASLWGEVRVTVPSVGCQGVAGGWAALVGWVGGAGSAEHPCPAEMALCNKHCHLLGGAGTVTLWSALHLCFGVVQLVFCWGWGVSCI